VKLEASARQRLSLSMSAEAMHGVKKPIAFVFGPENGAVSQSFRRYACKMATGAGKIAHRPARPTRHGRAAPLPDRAQATIGRTVTFCRRWCRRTGP
jgi:hypothetical protein